MSPWREKFANTSEGSLGSSNHELKDGELFQDYQVSGCAIEGDAIVDGKTFRYIEQPIHILQTTWPDGKMHELGGKHSDDSSIQ